jgi:hypothetical protein
MKNNPSSKALHRGSKVLLLMTCMSTAEGLRHQEAQRVLEDLPKKVAIEIIHLAITSRGNLKELFSSNNILCKYIYEPDPEDVLGGLPPEFFNGDETKYAA